MSSIPFTPNSLLHEAVEEACEKNPRLVLMPYDQMKQAALILAERLLSAEAAQGIEVMQHGVTKFELDEAEKNLRHLRQMLKDAQETVRKLLNGQNANLIPEFDPQGWAEIIAKTEPK